MIGFATRESEAEAHSKRDCRPVRSLISGVFSGVRLRERNEKGEGEKGRILVPELTFLGVKFEEGSPCVMIDPIEMSGIDESLSAEFLRSAFR